MWSDLTMRQRAFLISQGVRAGIGSANTIKKLYNEQQRKQLDGGHYFTNTEEMSMNDERMARVSDALRYGEGMSYSLPSVDIKAPVKEVPEKQYNINLQPYSAVASLPPLLPPASTNRHRIEPPKEKDNTYATLQEAYNPYIFNNYWTPDMNKYSTFKYALESNKNIKENKQRMLRDEQEIYDLYNIKTHV